METVRAYNFRIYPDSGCSDCMNAEEAHTVYGWEDVTELVVKLYLRVLR